MSNLTKNNLVAQTNRLIEARYTMTKNELLLLFAMVSLINPKDKNFLTFKTSVAHLSEILGIHPATAPREFDKITNRLLARVLTLKVEKGKWKKYQWVSYAELDGNDILLRFHKELKPYLLELKKNGNFTQYRLDMIIHFKSSYTIRMYQLLKEYQCKRMYTFDFSLEGFREMMLGEDSKTHLQFKNLKRHVLNVAQKELREQDPNTGFYKSDLSFELETRRSGRKISSLKFIIKTQETNPAPTTDSKIIENKNATKDDMPQIILEYEALGVMRKTTLPYLTKNGEQALIDTLQRFKADKKQGKIKKSAQGYLVFLLKINGGQQKNIKEEKEQEKITQAEKKEREKALRIRFQQEREEAAAVFYADQDDYDKYVLTHEFENSHLFTMKIKSVPVFNELYKMTQLEDKSIEEYFYS
ncbi:MAG: replication initiation protein, partial [Endozoicomonadaceae bacterium]|nr:replication initiation protein [Endozoicomonadaceae bacterium]